MTTSTERLLGLPPDKKVTIDEALWSSTQRLLARMMVSHEHMLREARLLLSRCGHSAGCPTLADPNIPCLMTCPDRETWLSARVVEQNCLEYVGQVGPFSKNHPYSPPTREYWDLIVGQLQALLGASDLLAELGKSLSNATAPTLKPPPPREQPTRRLIREPEIIEGTFDEQDEPQEGTAST